MKITYYIRDARDGNFSLEKIFIGIGEILKSDNEVSFFYINPKKSRWRNIQDASKCQGEINHITGDVNWIAYGLDKNKTILTVHDLGHYENTLTGLRKLVYRQIWWKWVLNRVSIITAISTFTKLRIIENFKTASEKIRVIYNPVSQEFTSFKSEFNKAKPSILQVGSMRNKNIDRLIQAVEDIPCRLLLLRMEEPKLIANLQRKNIDYEFFSNITEAEVINLYKRADFLFFASTYEGFGLPIIEAQATGKPVITSNIPPMSEVAGEAAYFVNPYSVTDIHNGIKQLISSEDLRKKLIHDGFINIERFNINNIAKQYMSLYQNIANAS